MNDQNEVTILFKPATVHAWIGRDVRRGAVASAATQEQVIDAIDEIRAKNRGASDLAASIRSIAPSIAQTGEFFALQVNDTHYNIIASRTTNGWELVGKSPERTVTIVARRKDDAFTELLLSIAGDHDR